MMIKNKDNISSSSHSLRLLITMNVSIFLLAASSLFFDHSPSDSSVLRALYSLIMISATFLLSGINLSVLFQILCKKNYDIFTTLTIGAGFALTIFPLAFHIIQGVTSLFSSLMPLLLSAAIFFILLSIFPRTNKKYSPCLHYSKKQLLLIVKKGVLSSFLWITVLYASVIFYVVTTYYALPDLDPYYWLKLYRDSVSHGAFSNTLESRGLFLTLAFIFIKTAAIDSYAFFKYVLPFLSLLILFPVVLLVRTFTSGVHRMVLLLFPFAAASTVLYSLTPFPQMLATILIVYFICFVFYSWQTSESLFYYLGGAFLAVGYFYHEILIVPLIFFIFSTLLWERKRILLLVQGNKFVTFFLFLIFFAKGLPIISHTMDLLLNWGRIMLTSFVHPQTNFLFPFHYSNIDGNVMGWESSFGVIKYYAYYVGPAIFLTTFYTIYLLLKKNSFREYFYKALRTKEIFTLFLSFLFFLTVAEILPRLLNIAFLPERAWVFGSLFFLVVPFLLFTFFEKKLQIFSFVVLISLLISTAGALYINGLKKYTITTAQLNSAEWIQTSLPQNRIIYSAQHRNLLQTHASSLTARVPQDFYYNPEVAYEILGNSKNSDEIRNEMYINKGSLLGSETTALKNGLLAGDAEGAILTIEKIIAIAKDLQTELVSQNSQQKSEGSNLYIYYSKQDANNPYASRPYFRKNESIETFLFDERPEEFQKIYNDTENDIYIWKIL